MTALPVSRASGIRARLLEPHMLLIGVCVLHALMALGFVISHHMWWEQDETVYLSQVAAHKPALLFTPPRARGMPVLLFPLVHFTIRVIPVRVYVLLLGTVAMYAGLRPWLRLGFSRVVAGSALLFSTLWAATFFGAEAQPNFLVAMLSLVATGYFLVATGEDSRRRHLAVLVVAVALLGLIRPSDATWLCAALAVVMIVMRLKLGRVPLAVGGALLVGLVLGWSEWVIEAQASYGGFFHRLHEANAYNTPGLHFSLLAQASGVNGPTLCRPCDQAVSVPHVVWWFAVPPLVAAGLWAARGTRRFLPLVVATAVGTMLLVEYLLTVSYAAPRFLLPSYALLALPCAAGLAALLAWRPAPLLRVGVATVLAAALAAQVISQTHYLRSIVGRTVTGRQHYLAGAAKLHSKVHRPCVMYGPAAPPIAFVLGCNDHPQFPTIQPQVATGTTVVVMTKPGLDITVPPGSRPLRLFRRHGAGHGIVAHIFAGK